MKAVLNSMLADAGAALADGPGAHFTLHTVCGRQLQIPASPFPYGDPLTIDKLPDCARGIVHATKAVADLAQQVHLVGRNDHLTDKGREDKLKGPREQALKTFAAAYETGVVAHKVSTDALEAQRYALPKAESSNYARERHILDLVLSAKSEQHPDIMRHLLEGEDDEAIVALQRAPKIMRVLMGSVKFGQEDTFSSLATKAWRALIDKRDPDGLQSLKYARELNEWGERSFAILAGNLILPGKSGSLISDAQRNNREALWELTTAGRAHRLFAISDAEAARYEQHKQRTAR